MSETRKPETLAEVKAGDEVWVFISQEPGQLLTVQRLTPKRFVLADGGTFSRDDGYEVGTGRRFIQFGDRAMEQRRWRDRLALFNKAELYPIHARGKDHVTQEQVGDYRAACDRAEAVLRELGEWSDEP